MATTNISSLPAASVTALPQELDREALIRVFRLMYLSRTLDDREILLKRQNKIFFQISGAGHEAVQIAAGLALRPGEDWVVPYYRDRALCLTLGMTAEDMLLQAVGAARDPSSGGRQMPSHWSSPKLRILTGSSPTGTQFLQAAGCAQGKRYQNPDSEEITLVCGGEGATSEGEFWECMNAACLERLPLLVLVEDNGYAISVPVERQTAGGNIARLLEGFPNLLRLEIDGTSFVESFRALQHAVAYCRGGHGPALVHAAVIRPYSHSLSDDERLYKPPAEREQEASRDPLRTFPELLVREGILDRHAVDLITREIDKEVAEISLRVLRDDPPPQGSALQFLYSDRVDPCSRRFEAEPHLRGEPRTMVDAINQTVAEEMRRDPRVLVFGEDVADCSREQNLTLVKGKG
ncbi:MAG: dehydrogenase, partial [Acidobacteriaceae bacterium]|nr:dehydrogenase [Acidobacteriaceae bacterium]